MSVHTRFVEGQFAPVAMYKGATVAVKKVKTGAGFVIGKQQMVDLKQVHIVSICFLGSDIKYVCEMLL